MEVHQEEPQTNTKTHLSSPNIILALGVKKTQQTNRSDDLQSTYLQQFKWYPQPLVPLPLKVASQPCWSPQPSQPRYNLVPLLEEQVHQEEVRQEEAEEELQEEEDNPEEQEALTNQPREMENLWVHY